MISFVQQSASALALLLAASVWGLYWWPLRYMETLQLAGPWAALMMNAPPVLLLLPVVLWRRATMRRYWRVAMLAGLFTGAAMALYALGLVYSSVIRATLLFYLTPIWSTLAARLWLGEAVGAGLAVGAVGVEGQDHLVAPLGVELGVLPVFAAVDLALDHPADRRPVGLGLGPKRSRGGDRLELAGVGRVAH